MRPRVCLGLSASLLAVAFAACGGNSTATTTTMTPGGGGNSQATPARSGPTSSSASSATGAAGSLKENLALTGTFSGSMTSAVLAGGDSSCGPDGNGGFNADLYGSVGGQTTTITLQDGNYMGPMTYTNEVGEAGDITFTIVGGPAPGNWTSVSLAYTVTINADQKSGTVAVDLRPAESSNE